MGAKSRAKAWAAGQITAQLNRRGFELTRPRFHEENPIDLRAILAEQIQEREGNVVVLQIGANDGVVNDPIHDAVSTYGWELYAIEPVPATFARLERNKAGNPRVHDILCAVGSIDGTTPLYTIRQDVVVDGLPYDQFASFSREVVERRWRYIPNVDELVEAIDVPTCTITSLLERYAIPRVDLMQIDTEGFDFEIIKMAFAADLVPPILAFEWVNLSRLDMWDCRCALIDHGYRWLIDKGDVIAARDVPWRAPPPTFRTYVRR